MKSIFVFGILGQLNIDLFVYFSQGLFLVDLLGNFASIDASAFSLVELGHHWFKGLGSEDIFDVIDESLTLPKVFLSE